MSKRNGDAKSASLAVSLATKAANQNLQLGGKKTGRDKNGKKGLLQV